MPSFGHVFYGLCLLIPILYFAREKFNYKVAFIFLFNQIYGPDFTFLFFDTTFHTILGFAILAIPLALVYSYASRFSLQKSEKGFRLKFEDGGIREIKWRNAYLLTIAGGISHHFIDYFFHLETTIEFWPSVTITYDQMLGWGGPVYHIYDPLMVIGEIIVVVALLLSLWYFHKGAKETAKVFAIVSGISAGIMLLGAFGIGGLTAVYGGERELAVYFFGALYVLLPLMFVMYVARNVLDHPVQTPDQPKIPRERHLKIVASIGVLLGAFFVLYGILAISISDTLAELIESLTGGTPNPNTANTVVFLGYYYASIAVVLLVGSIGLFFRSRICRYLAMAGALYFSILGFPLAIALFLCEKDVKALFAPKPRN